MSATILLISVNQCAMPYPVYPLGVSCIAAALRSEGHSVLITDMNFEADKLDAIVAANAPGFIGLSLRNIDDHRIDGTAFFVPALLDIVKRIRRISDVPLLLGGSAYSLFPEQLLEATGADYGIVGEGEAAMPKLIGVLDTAPLPDKASLASVPGLVYRQGGGIVRNAVLPLQANALPAPYRQSNVAGYYRSNGGVAGVQTQRGCPFSCCYCSYPLIEGREVRARDPAEVVEEIEEEAARGTRYFFFVDSVFNIDDRHAVAVCEELLARDTDIAWGCFLRPKGISGKLMELMARAGLRHAEFGTDSLCDTVLAAYGKQFTVDDIIEADAAADAANVRHAHFLVCGGPGETEATLHESFANSLRLKRTVIMPFVGMRLYPRTPLHRQARREGVIGGLTDLLPPYFYIASGLTMGRITELLDDFHARSPRWVVRDPAPEQRRVIERLRAKGVGGPLWEFLAH